MLSTYIIVDFSYNSTKETAVLVGYYRKETAVLVGSHRKKGGLS
jgi:hypothetical protein